MIFWPRNDLAPLLCWRRHCMSVKSTVIINIVCVQCLQQIRRRNISLSALRRRYRTDLVGQRWLQGRWS